MVSHTLQILCMSQNCQTHFTNLPAFAAKYFKYEWQFWDIMHCKGSELTLKWDHSYFLYWKLHSQRKNIISKNLKSLTSIAVFNGQK